MTLSFSNFWKQFKWKPFENKWCLLEIVCHLWQKTNFRPGTRKFLTRIIAGINWSSGLKIAFRNYMVKNFPEMLNTILDRSSESLTGFNSLNINDWRYLKPFIRNSESSTPPISAVSWLLPDFSAYGQILNVKMSFVNRSRRRSMLKIQRLLKEIIFF